VASEPDAAPDRPQHVKCVKGRWYWDPPDRLRRSHGLKTKPLGADQAAAWSLARTLNRDHLALGPGAPAIGSVSWLLEAFLASDRFAELAASTQRDYRWIAQRVLPPLPVASQELGRYPATSIRPRHADAIHALLRAEHGASAAHYACRVARRIWHWGARREMVDAAMNPWAGMELRGIAPREQRWTPAQVEIFRTKAREEGSASVALAVSIAYWFGHRQADVLGLTWSALDAGEVRTRKTQRVAPVDVAAYPELEIEIAAERARQKFGGVASTHVVVCEATQRPWERHGFGHEFRRLARLAGLPDDLQFRDLRATALTELSDAGADLIALSTHSTHQTPAMARRYVRRTAAQFSQAAGLRVAKRGKESELCGLGLDR